MSTDESGKGSKSGKGSSGEGAEASSGKGVEGAEASSRKGGKSAEASSGKGAEGSESGQAPDRVLRAKPEKPEPKKRNWKAILVGALIFFALVGALAAWLQGKASRQPEVDRLTGQRDECRDEKSALQGTMRELEAQIEVLEARRQIARAADELGEQNFGSANDALTAAADTLRAHGHGGLADRLGEVATTPTDDVTEPRNAALAIGRDLDRTLGR